MGIETQNPQVLAMRLNVNLYEIKHFFNRYLYHQIGYPLSMTCWRNILPVQRTILLIIQKHILWKITV